LNTEKEKQMEFLRNIAKLLGLSEEATEQEVTAKVEALRGAGDFIKLGAKETGLPETATGGQVIAAIKGLKQPGPACGEVLDALGLEHDASRSEIVASIHALRQRPDASVIQEIAALKAKLASRDRDELVAAALKDGKITPAQKDWAEKYALDDPEGFKLFVARAPQVVPVGGPKPAGGTARHGIDDNQLHINKLLGVSEEEFKKYNPAEA
jgi:phage I-like protein